MESDNANRQLSLAERPPARWLSRHLQTAERPTGPPCPKTWLGSPHATRERGVRHRLEASWPRATCRTDSRNSLDPRRMRHSGRPVPSGGGRHRLWRVRNNPVFESPESRHRSSSVSSPVYPKPVVRRQHRDRCCRQRLLRAVWRPRRPFPSPYEFLRR